MVLLLNLDVVQLTPKGNDTHLVIDWLNINIKLSRYHWLKRLRHNIVIIILLAKKCFLLQRNSEECSLLQDNESITLHKIKFLSNTELTKNS